MTNALKLTNVTKQYKDFKLDGLSFTLPSGCIMGLIGENGAGKSTTIKLLLDLVKRDGGDIELLGSDPREINKMQKEDIGVVLDESCFPENLAIREITKIMRSIYKNWNEDTFKVYIKKFDLPEKKPIKDFSRGMKMKLSIAVALSHATKLLILDEATSGLDPIVRDEILDVFLDFIQDEGHSILISSHIISDLEKICDYITFIHKGKLVFSDSKDALLEQYGILKCPESQFASIDKSIVRGYRKNSFGVEALVLKNKVSGNAVIDPASIEDIMLYYIKEGVK